MAMRHDEGLIKNELEAVITSYNQGTMILEAVDSLCQQTQPPMRIIIVDDGSTEQESLAVLEALKSDTKLPIPIVILQQTNSGVSAARNTGIRYAQAPLVLVLDGDDQLEPTFIQQVAQLLAAEPTMIAASAWLQTFGVLEATVRPKGGE